MKIGIISGGGMPAGLAEALMEALGAQGIEAEHISEQAQDAGPNPDYEPEEVENIADGLSDPDVTIKLSELTEIYAQRDQLAQNIEHLLDTGICKDCAEASAQELRIFAWAGAKFVAGTRNLAKPIKWNDLPELTRESLYNEAKAELAAFDEAQG